VSVSRRKQCMRVIEVLKNFPFFYGSLPEQELTTFTGNIRSVNVIAITLDCRRAVAGSDKGALKMWNLKNEQGLAIFHCKTGSFTEKTAATLKVRTEIPDNYCAISASSDNRVRVWDLKNGAIIADFFGDASLTICVYMNKTGSSLIRNSIGLIYILRLDGIIKRYLVAVAILYED